MNGVALIFQIYKKEDELLYRFFVSCKRTHNMLLKFAVERLNSSVF